MLQLATKLLEWRAAQRVAATRLGRDHKLYRDHGGYTGAMHDQQIKVRTYVTVAFQIIASLPQPLFTKQGN